MTATHAEMHNDHRQWLSDAQLWADDLYIWQREIDEALDGMKKLEAALRDHRDGLQKHSETIAEEEKNLTCHEKALAEYEQGGSGDALSGMTTSHQTNAEKHVRQRILHERLKKHHHTLIAHWMMLLKALTQKI
jgi:chromosome segregation ATPase